MPMTHDERRRRRKRAAEMVLEGKPVEQVASALSMCINTIYDSCREFGVKLSSYTRTSPSAMAILGALFRAEPDAGYPSLREVARQFGVRAQYVHQVYVEARKFGIPVPVRPPVARKATANGRSSPRGAL